MYWERRPSPVITIPVFSVNYSALPVHGRDPTSLAMVLWTAALECLLPATPPTSTHLRRTRQAEPGRLLVHSFLELEEVSYDRSTISHGIRLASREIERQKRQTKLSAPYSVDVGLKGVIREIEVVTHLPVSSSQKSNHGSWRHMAQQGHREGDLMTEASKFDVAFMGSTVNRPDGI